MTFRRPLCATVVVALTLIARAAGGEPLRLRHAAVCQNDHGTLSLEAGAVILSAPGEFDAFDARLKAAENALTGLKAENASLRASAQDDAPGWKAWVVAASAVAGGIAIGWYARR